MRIRTAAPRYARVCVLASLALVAGRTGAALPTPAAPIAVFVHGGGWMAGTPAMGHPMSGFFVARGMAFDAIDYPKRPDTPLGQMVRSVTNQIEDAGAGKALTVIGHSAGAHLAATAAFRVGAPPVRCLILLDGIGYDLVDLLTRDPGISVRLGVTPTLAAAWSPTALVPDSDRRPAVFIAAGGDPRGTADQARAFARVLEGNGLDVTLRVYATADHSDFLTEFANPDSRLAKSVAAFLVAHPRCGAKS